MKAYIPLALFFVANLQGEPLESGFPVTTYCLSGKPDVFVNVSYTFWTAREEGLSASIANISLVGDPSLQQGKVAYPSWQAVPGFKVGIGAYLNYDGWDLEATYTWFKNRKSTFSSFEGTPGQTVPIFFPANFLGPVDESESMWNNRFNRVDLLLGRGSYLGNRLTSKPCFGLLGASDLQTFNIDYTTEMLFEPYILSVESRQKWFGIGPYLAYKNSFYFLYGDEYHWAFFIDGGAALTWGKYKTKTMTSDNSGNLFFDTKSSFYNMEALLEIALGLRFEVSFSEENAWSLLCQLGWEAQTLFGHNRMTLWNSANTGNNYGMQGLTLKAELAF